MKEKFSIYIPPDLMKEFRKKCIDKGISMSVQIEEFLKEWLKK